MTKTEFAKVVMMIKGLYPKEKDLLCDDSTLEIWFSMLSDLSFETAVNAVKKHAVKCKFSPSVAEIRENAADENQASWQELYERSMRIVARYGIYNEQGGMDALDDMSREIVRHIGYKRICNSNEHDPYIRNEFRDTFQDVTERGERMRITGADVKCLM